MRWNCLLDRTGLFPSTSVCVPRAPAGEGARLGCTKANLERPGVGEGGPIVPYVQSYPVPAKRRRSHLLYTMIALLLVLTAIPLTCWGSSLTITGTDLGVPTYGAGWNFTTYTHYLRFDGLVMRNLGPGSSDETAPKPHASLLTLDPVTGAHYRIKTGARAPYAGCSGECDWLLGRNGSPPEIRLEIGYPTGASNRDALAIPIGQMYNTAFGDYFPVTVILTCPNNRCVEKWKGRNITVCVGESASRDSSRGPLHRVSACLDIQAIPADVEHSAVCSFDAGDMTGSTTGKLSGLDGRTIRFHGDLVLRCDRPIYGQIRLVDGRDHISLDSGGVRGRCDLNLGQGITGRYHVRGLSYVATSAECTLRNISGSGVGSANAVLIFEPDSSVP